MLIGVPTEIKSQENRVGLNPESVKTLIKSGHDVIVETNAGQGIFATDQDYADAGARIAPDADSVFDQADMIIKVKEPQPIECQKLKPDQILFTYLHLAPDPEQAKGLIQSRCVAIAYETVTGEEGKGLPLLRPMSEVAGSMAPLMGAVYGAKHFGGRGDLISGVTGVPVSNILILGGGVSGFAAAKIASGLGAKVTITDMSDERITFLNTHFDGRVQAIKAGDYSIADHLHEFDMVIGAVLIPGGSAPKLITKGMLALMKPRAMMVDIAIDQGGCFETSRPTTHADPVYEVDDVMHYCVANMPGAYPMTSTAALNNATLPYIQAIADKGWKQAVDDVPGLKDGLNIVNGEIVHPEVKSALGF
jgi:alanine dehydrogenase